MADATLHVVCPNPALDRLQTVEHFRPFEVNRVTSVRSLPGGKGMIVCRAARRMDARVTAHGFAGGAVGRIIRAGCVDLGVADHHVEIAGETRVTPVVIEQSTGRSTVLNERGPHISPAEQSALLEGLGSVVRPGDVVVSTGSLPPGCDGDLHARVARLAVGAGALAIVDAHGAALAAVIDAFRSEPAAGGLVVKPNALELGEVVGSTLHDAEAVLAATQELVAATGATFVITLGADGAVWAGRESWSVAAPRVETVNATGSGDSFLAGLAVALGDDRPAVEALTLATAMGAANAANLTPDVDPVLVRALREDIAVTWHGGAA